MNILWPGYLRPLFLGDIFIKRKTDLEVSKNYAMAKRK